MRTSNLRESYRGMRNDDLLRLAVNKDSLVEEGKRALELEMARRRLNKRTVQQYSRELEQVDEQRKIFGTIRNNLSGLSGTNWRPMMKRYAAIAALLTGAWFAVHAVMYERASQVAVAWNLCKEFQCRRQTS